MFYNFEVYKNVKDLIEWKKGEAHEMDWLYIEVDDTGLLAELDLRKRDLSSVRLAMTNCLLEGDGVLSDTNDLYSARYYVDNLKGRRKVLDI